MPIFGRAYARQPGLVTNAQVAAWRRVTDAVHGSGGVILAQIMHAGALSQCLEQTLAPSAIAPLGRKMPEYGGSGSFPIPRAMQRDDINRVVETFARAAGLALASGFDGIEIHGANGYLIDQFLTDYTNHRTDEYGGDARARTRFACDVLRAVRDEIGARPTVGIRLSQTKVNNFTYRWPGGEADGAVIFAAVRAAGASYIHIAGEGRDWRDSAELVGSERALTELARGVTNIPVIANGGLHDPELAESLVRNGQTDLVSLARTAIANPDWPGRLRTGQDLRSFETNMIHPQATLENTDHWRAGAPARAG
jgi:2,4-dienoyl-CoA reductase-like NADH-dependent reductase (Old Yellow Enzyme family)